MDVDLTTHACLTASERSIIRSILEDQPRVSEGDLLGIIARLLAELDAVAVAQYGCTE